MGDRRGATQDVGCEGRQGQQPGRGVGGETRLALLPKKTLLRADDELGGPMRGSFQSLNRHTNLWSSQGREGTHRSWNLSTQTGSPPAPRGTWGQQHAGTSLHAAAQKSPDTPGSPEGNTEGPGTASSEPLLPS